MFNQQTKKPGYILVLTFLILSFLVVILTQLFLRAGVYLPYARAIEDRERAKMLARSGIQIAISQLYLKKKEKDKEAQENTQPLAAQPAQGGEKKPAKKTEEAEFFEKVFPLLNTWQTFTLNNPEQGIDGTIKIYLACEDGKIDLNFLFDEKTQTFKNAKKQGDFTFLIPLLLAKLPGVGDKSKGMITGIESVYKKSNGFINDVSQLLGSKEFDVFGVWLFPSPHQREDQIPPLFDIFTVFSSGRGIDPWMFSRSVSSMLSGKLDGEQKEGSSSDAKQLLVKEFKPNGPWGSMWDKVFAKVYHVEWKALPQGTDRLLTTKFMPKTFSVVSYGVSRDIVQRAYAIVQRESDAFGDAKYVIRKFYWIL
jgi:hypothetical protein